MSRYIQVILCSEWQWLQWKTVTGNEGVKALDYFVGGNYYEMSGMWQGKQERGTFLRLLWISARFFKEYR
jgi:hypothetical protein